MKNRRVHNLSKSYSSFLSDELKDRIDCNEKSGIDTGLENNALDIKN